MVPRAGEHWTAVAGMDGAFGAEKIVDEDLLLETLLLPSTGLLGSGTIREKQLSLHKWVVSLAGLREELSTQVRKVHQTKAIMTEQKMREQTRLLEQLNLILKAAKSSFDGHLSSMRDLNADVSVLVQKMVNVLHAPHALTHEQWEVLKEHYDRVHRRRSCMDFDVTSRDFFSFYSADEANPLAAVARVRELEEELEKARAEIALLQANYGEERKTTSALKASLDAMKHVPEGREGPYATELDAELQDALAAFERRFVVDTTTKGEPGEAPPPPRPSTSGRAPVGGAVDAKGLEGIYKDVFKRMMQTVQKVHNREKVELRKTIKAEAETRYNLVESKMAHMFAKLLPDKKDGAQMRDSAQFQIKKVQQAQIHLLEEENKGLLTQLDKIKDEAQTQKDYALYQLRSEFEGQIASLKDHLERVQQPTNYDFTSREAQDRYVDRIRKIEEDYTIRIASQEHAYNSLLQELKDLKAQNVAGLAVEAAEQTLPPPPRPRPGAAPPSPQSAAGLPLPRTAPPSLETSRKFGPEEIADIAMAISTSQVLETSGHAVPEAVQQVVGRLRDLPPEVLAAAAKAAAESSTQVVDRVLQREEEKEGLVRAVASAVENQEIVDQMMEEGRLTGK